MDAGSSSFWVSIGFSLLCGSVIGLERQLRGKPAGLRTCALVCLGTTVFVRLAATMPGEALGRVVANVVVGIGFLGAGVIMNKRDAVRGLTSAAVIWALAALGSVIAMEAYGAALVLTAIILVVLSGVDRAEKAFARLRRGEHEDDEPSDP